MFVKICGITNEDDALLAVAMGADALGFVFAPSPRQIPVQQAYDISRRLPPEILTVGVFRDEHPKRRHRDRAPCRGEGASQLHGNESKAAIVEVAKAVRFVIKAYPAGSPKIANVASLPTDTLLIDGPSPGSGQLFDWSLVGEVPRGDAHDPRRRADARQRRRRREDGRTVGRRRGERRRGRRRARRTRSRSSGSSSAPAPRRRCRTSADDELPYDWSSDEWLSR